jgi:hypothetical protein
MKTHTASPSVPLLAASNAAAAGSFPRRRPGPCGARLARAAIHALLVGAVLLPTASAQKLAKSGGAPINFPVSGYSFEHPSVTALTPDLVLTGQTWNGWTFGATGGAGHGSGISHQTSVLAIGNGTPPNGTDVGVLVGDSSIQATVTVTRKKTFRLRFYGTPYTDVNGSVVHDQGFEVTVDGQRMGVFEPSTAGYKEFVTRPWTIEGPPTQTSVVVKIETTNATANTLALIDDVRLEPISMWSDPDAWSPIGVPLATDSVTIGAAIEMAIVTTGAKAQKVSVLGALLASNRTGDLSTGGVEVSGAEGMLEVGRLEAPFQQAFTLTLIDSPPYLAAGPKSLAAFGSGTIQLHGQQRLSWTKLTQPAAASTSTLQLGPGVDWQPGDEIVIAGTTHQQSTLNMMGGQNWPNYIDYAEKRTIASISGSTVTLTTPLSHDHHGGAVQIYGGNWKLDQSAEVGLLTHNVKVQGDASSGTPAPPNRVGAHIKIHRGGIPVSAGRAYLSHVELYRVGHEKQHGRYPIHWHMLLDQAAGQYIEDSSIHESYNRAVTIHGTDSLRIERNVVYSSMGHAIFLEDGVEQFHEINHNLVLSTIRPDPGNELLISDNQLEELQNRSPSSFWITNPANEFIGNVAGGTEGTGFWFALAREPMGESAMEPFFNGRNAVDTDLGAFQGNVCHSSGTGIDVNDSIFPDGSIETNVGWNPSASAILLDFVAWGNATGIYSGSAGFSGAAPDVIDEIFYKNAILTDNNEHIRLAAYQTVTSSAVIRNTGNVSGFTGNRHGYIVYDGAGRMTDCYMEGFQVPGAANILGGGGATFHPNHLFSGMSFSNTLVLPTVFTGNFAGAVDAQGVPIWTDPSIPDPECNNSQHLADPRTWGVALRDVDGSLWSPNPLTPGRTLIGNHPLMYTPGAPSDVTPAGLPPVSQYTKLVTHRYGHLRIHKTGGGAFLPTTWIRREAKLPNYPATVDFENCFTVDIHKQWPVIVRGGFEFNVHWANVSAIPGHSIDVTLDDVETTDAVLVTLEDIGGQANLSVSNLQQVFTQSDLLAATTSSYFVDAETPVADLRIHFVAVDQKLVSSISWQ